MKIFISCYMAAKDKRRQEKNKGFFLMAAKINWPGYLTKIGFREAIVFLMYPLTSFFLH